MKKFFVLGMLLILLGVTVGLKEDLIKVYNKLFLKIGTEVVSLGDKNEYYRDYDFDFVQNTNDFSPKNRQDILNIYYTAINAGKNTFTFYCPSSYKECLNEVDNLANDQTTLSHINNFVHPFNGFKNIETEYDSLGKVKIKIEKSYTKEEIEKVEKKVKSIEKEVITSNSSLENNIKNIHDYIINNSKYDSNRSDNNIVKYKSDISYGPLIEGYGLCGGYTDAMELFLEDLNVKSFKVSSENHVWNAVYLNNSWLNLDLTWDDPVTTDSSDVLNHDFFLITTEKLASLETSQHSFDLTIYSELKEK